MFIIRLLFGLFIRFPIMFPFWIMENWLMPLGLWLSETLPGPKYEDWNKVKRIFKRK